MTAIVVATRKSALALAQTRAFIAALRERVLGLETSELHVTTTGDRIQDRPLAEVGGKGLFVKEIEEALLDGRAHLAVHSAKDVPAELAPSLDVACVPRREDPRDVILTRGGVSFAALPPGSRVGTSSLRRRVQLSAARGDLEYVPLRGNVDTRLRKLHEGSVDAVVLARAGLVRLGLGGEAMEFVEPELCLPAIGQGCLAIETRSEDESTRALLACLHDADAALALAVERGVMRAVSGSCQIPVAAYAVRAGETLWVRAFLAEADGSRVRTAERREAWPKLPSEAARMGEELGHELRAQ
jgi:hydroxymethylbilane synthase